MGLSTSPATLEKVTSGTAVQDSGVTDELGVPLTLAEFREIEFRQQVIEQDAPKVRAVAQKEGMRLGGGWTTPAAAISSP